MFGSFIIRCQWTLTRNKKLTFYVLGSFIIRCQWTLTRNKKLTFYVLGSFIIRCQRTLTCWVFVFVAAAASSYSNDSGGGNVGGLIELRCSWNNMMGKAVDSAGPYLYPCTIEYSLMCAGKL